MDILESWIAIDLEGAQPNAWREIDDRVDGDRILLVGGMDGYPIG